MSKMSRLEGSKEVRRVLNRFGVDLGQCQYGVYGREICLTGYLMKTDGSEFGGQEIEYMIHEFQAILRGYTVRGDMENWRFSSDHIASLGGEEEEVQEESSEEAA